MCGDRRYRHHGKSVDRRQYPTKRARKIDRGPDKTHRANADRVPRHPQRGGHGPDPFAMLLTDGAADTQQFAIFGNFEAAPSMTRNYINHLSVAIDITESM